jgi:hypothetical protein
MAIFRGQKRSFVDEIKQSGVVTETEYEARMQVLMQRIEQIENTQENITGIFDEEGNLVLDFGEY